MGDELALQRRLLFKEEALALVDARRVGLAIDELAVELAAEQVDFGARTMFCVHKLALLPHQAALHARQQFALLVVGDFCGEPSARRVRLGERHTGAPATNADLAPTEGRSSTAPGPQSPIAMARRRERTGPRVPSAAPGCGSPRKHVAKRATPSAGVQC